MKKSDWEKNKYKVSWFSTDESKRMTNLFWKSQSINSQLQDMGFMR